MQWGTFLFFAGCVAVMTTCVALLLPETKGVPLEEVSRIWEQHPVWGKVVGRNPRESAPCPEEDHCKSME